MRKNALRRFSGVILIEDIETPNGKLSLSKVLLLRLSGFFFFLIKNNDRVDSWFLTNDPIGIHSELLGRDTTR